MDVRHCESCHFGLGLNFCGLGLNGLGLGLDFLDFCGLSLTCLGLNFICLNFIGLSISLVSIFSTMDFLICCLDVSNAFLHWPHISMFCE